MADTTTTRLGRIALILSALLMVASVGARIWRDRTPPPAPQGQAPTQPDVGQMIAQLERQVKAHPDDAEGWRMLGWSLFQTQRFAESAQAYDHATQLSPGKSDLWSSLGEARVMMGAGDVPPDARAAFEKAVSLDPRDPRARYFLAVAKDMTGDHKGAIDAWLALLRDTPSGAPWEADVRQTVERVGAKDHIEVARRLAAIRRPPAAPPAGVASAAIPGPTPDQMRAASALPPGAQQQMISGMVDGLAAKLKSSPGDVDGWIMLMRSRVQLGQQGEAHAALASAKAANPGAREQLDTAARELGL